MITNVASPACLGVSLAIPVFLKVEPGNNHTPNQILIKQETDFILMFMGPRAGGPRTLIEIYTI